MPYVVKATVRGRRVIITKPSTKETTLGRASDLRKEIKSSIPEYQWAKNIRVARTKHTQNALTKE